METNMENHNKYIRLAIKVAKQAKEKGNHPFGAILVNKQGEVLLEAENSVTTEHDCTGHAETNLMRKASKQYDSKFLSDCTLYTSTEPCVMCSGAIYWGGVGRVVYGLSELGLYSLTGKNEENPTLNLPCREVFAKGQKSIEVVGPVLEDEAKKVHQEFWD